MPKTVTHYMRRVDGGKAERCAFTDAQCAEARKYGFSAFLPSLDYVTALFMCNRWNRAGGRYCYYLES